MLAVLTAARLEAAGHTVDAVYTYGAPRPVSGTRRGLHRNAWLAEPSALSTTSISSHGFHSWSELPPCRETDVLDSRENLHTDAGAWHIARDVVIARLSTSDELRLPVSATTISAYARLIEAIRSNRDPG